MQLEIDIEVEWCVYKLYYGEKYIIVKAKTLAGSIFLIEKGYTYFLSMDHKDFEGKNSHYFKFYSYMKNNPGLSGKVEVILESNNGYQLLKAEQQALNKAFNDKNCLNNNIHAYIPKFRNDMYGWIKPTWVLNYKKFLKSG